MLTPNATSDMLAGLWSYVVSRIMRIAAGLAIMGVTWSVWQNRPWMRFVACAQGFLTVAGL